MSLVPVATYDRTITASLERVWENVLDWEHLPWLHSTSFAGVHLLEERRDGWRAEVTLQPASATHEAEIDVRIDRAARRYVSATVGGFGAGSAIVTSLSPMNAHTTAIELSGNVGVMLERLLEPVSDAPARRLSWRVVWHHVQAL